MFSQKNILLLFVLLLMACSSGETRMIFEPWQAPRTVEIVFSGDFMQHLPQVNAARKQGGGFAYDATLRNIAPYWKSADFAVINLETTLAGREPYTGYPMFRSPQEIAYALRRAGITHCALANNHAMDAGYNGARTTIETLDSAGIAHMGVYLSDRPTDVLYLAKQPFKIALLNYTYGTNGMPVPRGVSINLLDTTLIAAQIAQAEHDSATHIIAFVHWGDEYQRLANASQRKLGAWLRLKGVDVVVGSHPHVVQQIDPKAQIIYSLGNFVSNQRERYKSSGISARLKFYEGHRRAQISYLPHYVDGAYNIILTNQEANRDSREAVMQWIETK